MNSDIVIESIKNRILSEYRKHKDLDWALIAAKKIYSSHIKPPEVVKQRSVAVISLDTNDYQDWIFENVLDDDIISHRRKHILRNVIYYCISSKYDLCSLSVDDIVETKHAVKNQEYDDIKSIINNINKK